MTTSDISEAQRLARECVEKNYRVVELPTIHRLMNSMSIQNDTHPTHTKPMGVLDCSVYL